MAGVCWLPETPDELIEAESSSTIRRLPDGTAYCTVKVPTSRQSSKGDSRSGWRFTLTETTGP
jgi:hypothetical protein